MSFIADKVVMDGLTFEHSVEYPFSFRRYGHGYRSSNGYCHSS